MKLAIVRGQFLNQYEMQNFVPLTDSFKITAFASHHPIHAHVGLPTQYLLSPTDLPKFPYKMPLLNRFFSDANYLCGLDKCLNGFDIVHVAETYYHFTAQALAAKRQGRVKYVVSTVWETIPHNHEGIRGRRQMKQRAIRELNHFITPTKKAKQALIAEGCHPRKISVIPMGVSIPQKPVKIQTQVKRLLYVGRLETEKGIWDLLQALKSLTQYRLTIVGEGSQKNKILKYLKNNSLQNSVTLTKSTYQNITKYYQEADLLIVPSKPTQYWEEQYGMVVVEGLAHGVPILASNCGAIPEVLSGCGWTYEAGNILDLVHQLGRILNSSARDRETKAAKARELAKTRYDNLKTAKILADLYNNLT